ncbi:hypothetical protein Btru_058859 [Bulinus truncatus]|nr:hypothetical protein Btru_058859 [Bulinus truncatus]
MRIKVTPDEKQMIISTLGGYFLLIHNLDLVTLKEDLKGFKPNFYRSMQLLNLNSHKTLNFKRYFTRDKNRVEIVSDFPENDSAESICTVQVHPQGWCIASRNTTSDEKAEWTCIHDIQTLENITETDLEEDERPSPRNTVPNWHSAERLVLSEILDNNLETENLQSNNDTSSEEEPNVDSDEDEDILQGRSLIVHNSSPSHQLYPSNVEDTSSDDSSHTSSPASIYIIGSPAQGQRHNNANRRALANSFINLLSNHLISSSSGDGHNAEDSVLVEDSHSNIINGSAEVLSRIASFSESREAQTRQHTMFPNSQRLSTNRKKRLLFYSEEPNVGRGFIKEQSFSCDGKVLASPFANCVRLLGFNYECSELCDIVPEKPRNLCQVAMTVAQKSSILASTFSPVHCMFVAGARDGSISFCSPRF